MDATTARVVVIANTVGAPPEVYHRDFPEIRSQAHTIDEATASLLHALARAMDSALTNWRREGLEQAIAEVRTFADERAEEARRTPASSSEPTTRLPRP
jgi:hypothetical protein